MPGLDGLRGIAVLAVIAYHLGFDWAGGGLLGVGVFFTLSGYLITDILLERWASRRLSLREFWLGRARRLLPALLVVLVVVTAWVTIGDPARLDSLRGEVIASALFFSNWWFIFQDVSYFQQFGPPSPLGHTWSLAVEEQFYILWPAILLGGLALFGSRSGRTQLQPRLALATLGLALVSIILMVVLFTPGTDSTRAYEGTDTRAFGLLIGAALAMVWPSKRLTARIEPRAARTLDLVGGLGLVTIVLLIATTNEFSPFIYRGGLVILSVASAAVIASVAHPASLIGNVLGVSALRWIGVRSYGIYLWQSPIILLTTPAIGGFSPLRGFLQVGATFLIAAISWKYVEDPIRHGALGRYWHRAKAAKFRLEKPDLPWLSKAGVTATGLVFLSAFLGMVGLTTSKPLVPITSAQGDPSLSQGSGNAALSLTGAETDEDEDAPSSEAGLGKTACRSVAYIGESTSLGMVLSDIIPKKGQRLEGRLAAVGATEQKIDIAGSRSVFDAEPGTEGALGAARAIRKQGFKGCWIFSLGINDAGFVSSGYGEGAAARIESIMRFTDGEPVMWVSAEMLPTGELRYLDEAVEGWNEFLLFNCRKYPEMRVYDWGRDVAREWFQTDGIHYEAEGYVNRAELVAAALVSAFPSGSLSQDNPALSDVSAEDGNNSTSPVEAEDPAAAGQDAAGCTVGPSSEAMGAEGNRTISATNP